MDTLALRGVPLTVAHKVTEPETASQAYAAAQRAFDKARGDGTPLLPVPTTGDDRGPARYVRNVITAMLLRHVEGGDSRPLGEDEMRAAAEAHMALVETVASELANFNPDTPVPVAPPSSPAALARYAAIEYPRADWLSESILKSLVRMHSVDLPRSTAPTEAVGKDPLVRLAEESAFWRGVSPHGSMEKSLTDQRAALMGNVKNTPPRKIEGFDAPEEVQRPDFDQTWISTEAARLTGVLASKVQVEVDEVPSLDTVRAGVLRKMSSESKTPQGQRALVIARDSLDAFFANFDVMRDYVFQPV